jgi:hypothetical protein
VERIHESPQYDITDSLLSPGCIFVITSLKNEVLPSQSDNYSWSLEPHNALQHAPRDNSLFQPVEEIGSLIEDDRK